MCENAVLLPKSMNKSLEAEHQLPTNPHDENYACDFPEKACMTIECMERTPKLPKLAHLRCSTAYVHPVSSSSSSDADDNPELIKEWTKVNDKLQFKTTEMDNKDCLEHSYASVIALEKHVIAKRNQNTEYRSQKENLGHVYVVFRVDLVRIIKMCSATKYKVHTSTIHPSCSSLCVAIIKMRMAPCNKTSGGA